MKEVAIKDTTVGRCGTRTDPPDDLDIRRSRPIIRCHSVDDPDDVALYHANIVDMTILLCKFQEMLNEIHDVGTSVHVILREPVSWPFILFFLDNASP